MFGIELKHRTNLDVTLYLFILRVRLWYFCIKMSLDVAQYCYEDSLALRQTLQRWCQRTRVNLHVCSCFICVHRYLFISYFLLLFEACQMRYWCFVFSTSDVTKIRWRSLQIDGFDPVSFTALRHRFWVTLSLRGWTWLQHDVTSDKALLSDVAVCVGNAAATCTLFSVRCSNRGAMWCGKKYNVSAEALLLLRSASISAF